MMRSAALVALALVAFGVPKGAKGPKKSPVEQKREQDARREALEQTKQEMEALGKRRQQLEEEDRKNLTLPDETPVVLVIRGGISLGAYEAGLNWALLELLRYRRGDGEDQIGAPEHKLFNDYLDKFKFRVVAATGASAGNINAFLTLAQACQGKMPIGEDIFWKSWVPIGIDNLLPNPFRIVESERAGLGDHPNCVTEPEDRVLGPDNNFYCEDDFLLSRAQISHAGRDWIELMGELDAECEDSFPVAVPVTRTTPFDLEWGNDVSIPGQRMFVAVERVKTDEEGAIEEEERKAAEAEIAAAAAAEAAGEPPPEPEPQPEPEPDAEADPASEEAPPAETAPTEAAAKKRKGLRLKNVFAGSHGDGRDPDLPGKHATKEMGSVVVLPEKTGAIPLDEIVRVMKASSAVPGAFGPVQLGVCEAQGADAPADGKVCPNGDPGVTDRWFVDGGTFDTLPVPLGRFLVKEGAEGKLEGVKYFGVEVERKRPRRLAAREAGPGRGEASVQELIRNIFALIPTARKSELRIFARAPETSDEEKNTDTAPPDQYITDRYFPVVGDTLAAFGAFMGRPFREYDYYVGVYDGLVSFATAMCVSSKNGVNGDSPRSWAHYEEGGERWTASNDDWNERECFQAAFRRGYEILDLHAPESVEQHAAAYVVHKALETELQHGDLPGVGGGDTAQKPDLLNGFHLPKPQRGELSGMRKQPRYVLAKAIGDAGAKMAAHGAPWPPGEESHNFAKILGREFMAFLNAINDDEEIEDATPYSVRDALWCWSIVNERNVWQEYGPLKTGLLKKRKKNNWETYCEDKGFDVPFTYPNKEDGPPHIERDLRRMAQDPETVTGELILRLLDRMHEVENDRGWTEIVVDLGDAAMNVYLRPKSRGGRWDLSSISRSARLRSSQRHGRNAAHVLLPHALGWSYDSRSRSTMRLDMWKPTISSRATKGHPPYVAFTMPIGARASVARERLAASTLGAGITVRPRSLAVTDIDFVAVGALDWDSVGRGGDHHSDYLEMFGVGGDVAIYFLAGFVKLNGGFMYGMHGYNGSLWSGSLGISLSDFKGLMYWLLRAAT